VPRRREKDGALDVNALHVALIFVDNYALARFCFVESLLLKTRILTHLKTFSKFSVENDCHQLEMLSFVSLSVT
jgi:hypothetical protein